MADYPGLPNWGYGLRIEPETILSLIKGTPQRGEMDARRKYYEGQASSETEKNKIAQQSANDRAQEAWINEYGNLLSITQFGGKLSPEQTQLMQYLAQKIGLSQQANGLGQSVKTQGMTNGDLADATSKATSGENWFTRIRDILANREIGKMIAGFMTPQAPQGGLVDIPSKKLPIAKPTLNQDTSTSPIFAKPFGGVQEPPKSFQTPSENATSTPDSSLAPNDYLQGTGAALLAPFLGLRRAIQQTPSAAGAIDRGLGGANATLRAPFDALYRELQRRYGQ